MKVEHEMALLRLAMESDFPLPAAKNVCRTLADYLVAKRKGDHYQRRCASKGSASDCSDYTLRR